MRSPSLVPRWIRLGSAALAHMPMRTVPRDPGPPPSPATPTEAHRVSRRPGRRSTRQALEASTVAAESSQQSGERGPRPQQSEAGTTPGGDAEMLDILTEEGEGGEGQDANMGFVGSLEPGRDDFIGQFLLRMMGAGRSYVRERQQAARRILVSEIYSPPGSQRKLQKAGGSI